MNIENNVELTVNELYLQNFWNELIQHDPEDTIDFYTSQLQFVDGFKQQLIFDKDISGLYLKSDVWKLSVNPDSFQNLVNVPIVIGLLNYLGISQIASIVIPAIFQNLFKIQHIKVSKKDQDIYVHLPLKDENIYKTSNEWYNSLPKEYKKMINKLEFLDTMDNFVSTGLAKEKDGKYLVLSKGNNMFYFSFLK